MDKDFVRSFREIMRILDREIMIQNSTCRCNGVSLAQCHTLLEIEKNAEMSMSELAENLDLDKSTVSRTVDGLVNISMVERYVPNENRRKTLLNLTGNGKQVCSSINEANDTFYDRVLDTFSEEERKTFLSLLQKFTGNLTRVREEELLK
jgi:DNA-binding MarR family transcriptional regulator